MAKLQKSCESCGGAFSVYPSHDSRRFCSKTCWGQAIRSRVTRACDRCSAPVEMWPSLSRRQQKVFCSPACRESQHRFVDKGGYIKVSLSSADEFSEMRNKHDPYVYEHRLVMARNMGRALSSTETVHHINGDRSDNRIENLQLRVGDHGSGQAYCCADCGSLNLKSLPVGT